MEEPKKETANERKAAGKMHVLLLCKYTQDDAEATNLLH